MEGSLPGGGKSFGGRTGVVSFQEFQASSLMCSLGIFPLAPQGWEGVRESQGRLGPIQPEPPRCSGRCEESRAHEAACWWLLVPSWQPHPCGLVQRYKKGAYKAKNAGRSVAAGQHWVLPVFGRRHLLERAAILSQGAWQCSWWDPQRHQGRRWPVTGEGEKVGKAEGRARGGSPRTLLGRPVMSVSG